MALYSAWDWDRNAYRVYQTRRLVSVGDDPKPPKPKLRHPLGAVPDMDAKTLPPGAKMIGYSHQARGEIVRLPGSGALGDVNGSATDTLASMALVVLIIAGVGAFIAWGQRPRRA
ncbi:MAG TPA: hypothetical protein VIY27_04310 [Myxococcota bacterium]